MEFLEGEEYIYCKDLKYIKDNLSLLKESRYGKNSDIYIYKLNQLLKVFKDVDTINNMNNLKRLKELSTQSIVVPNKFLILDDQYYGFSMDKINGNILYNVSKNMLLKDLLKYFSDVLYDMKLISMNSFVVDDFNSFNIILDNEKKKAKVIDCNSIIYLKEESCEKLFILNHIRLYILILLNISNMSFFENNNFYLYMRDYISNMTDFSISLEQLFSYFIEELENIVDKDIYTIKDFQKALVLSKRAYLKNY